LSFKNRHFPAVTVPHNEPSLTSLNRHCPAPQPARPWAATTKADNLTVQKANVIVFSKRVEALRKTRAELALEQCARELRFKEAATHKSINEEDLSEGELIAVAHDTLKNTEVFRRCLTFWKRLAGKKSKQLASAEKKIARLKKQLASSRARSA
jgi:hypothetical protein